jgi:hypothetical protein
MNLWYVGAVLGSKGCSWFIASFFSAATGIVLSADYDVVRSFGVMTQLQVHWQVPIVLDGSVRIMKVGSIAVWHNNTNSPQIMDRIFKYSALHNHPFEYCASAFPGVLFRLPVSIEPNCFEH